MSISRQDGVWLIWAAIALLPFSRSTEIMTVLMSIAGLIVLVRHRAELFRSNGVKLYSIIFALVWASAAISWIDAVESHETLRTTLSLLRFYFCGLFIIFVLSSVVAWQRLLRLMAWLLIFWIADALLQWLSGMDLFGHEIPYGRVNGIFGEDHLKLGLILPVFSAFLIEYLREHWPKSLQWVVIVGLFLVVLFANSRAGWIMFSVLAISYFLILTKNNWRLRVVSSIAVSVVLAGGLFIAANQSEAFSARVDQSLLILSGDTEKMDRALSFRLPIWTTAVNMIEAHPINGVGARGFRYAYPQYAGEHDRFVRPGQDTGAMHSHQFVLEVLAETGVIGLLAWLIVFLILIKAWVHAEGYSKNYVMAPGLSLLLAFFPFNTHFAIYSSFWAQIVWWLIAVYCAALSLKFDKAD